MSTVSMKVFMKEAREKSGLTQMELAKKLGYTTAQFISNCERGRCLLPLNKAKAFLRYTKASAPGLKSAFMAEELKRIAKYF